MNRGNVRFGAIGIVSAIALSASGVAQAQTISSDKSDYEIGELLTATYADITGTGFESFVAIARTDDPDDLYSYWIATPFDGDGAVVFDHLPLGQHQELRYYKDYGLEILARSAEFSVSLPLGVSTELTADKTTYTPSENPLFTWTNAPGYAYDWVHIVLDGTPSTSYLAWDYTDGLYDGSMTFDDMIHVDGVDELLPFCFDVRLGVNDSYTDIAAADDFCVELPPGSSTITTDANEYTPSEPVDVCWEDAPGNLLDWVGIAKRALSPVELYSYTDINGDPLWRYIDGVVDGCLSSHDDEGVFLTDKVLGNYAARGFADDSYLAFANQALFVVNFDDGIHAPDSSATITTDKALYFVGEPVVVTYSNMPGSASGHDVLAVATTDFAVTATGPATWDANDPGFIAEWNYLRGAVSGVHTFYTVLDVGTYSVWGFEDDRYSVVGQSATFDVVLDELLAPHVWSIPTCIAPGTPELLIGYENILLGEDAWIGIFEAGSPADAFSLVWSWIGTSQEGEGLFPVDHIAEGEYDIRVLTEDREIAVQTTLIVSAECPTPVVTRDRDFYITGDTIVVDFDDFNGHEDERVGYILETADPDVDPYVESASTGSALSGTVEFTAGDPGIYVARGYMEWSKYVTATSEDFIICGVGMVPDCNGVCTPDFLIDPFECDSGDTTGG